MQILFPRTKSMTRECPECGRATTHEKEGTNHDLHAIITFVSFFTWTPVWIAMTLVERRRHFECRECVPALQTGESPQPV